MAAIAIPADTITRVVLPNPANFYQELALDERVRYVEIMGWDAAGTARDECYLALDAADGAALATAGYQTMLATEPAPRGLTIADHARRLGGYSIYLASGTASAVVEVRTSSRPR